jgi:hypothetical protein
MVELAKDSTAAEPAQVQGIWTRTVVDRVFDALMSGENIFESYGQFA